MSNDEKEPNKAREKQDKVIENLSNLSLVRQIAIMIGLAASVALGFGIVIWSQDPFYRPLLEDLSVVDASKAVDILEEHDIGYQIDVKEHILYVELQSADLARLKLAKNGFDVEFNGVEGSTPQRIEDELLKKCGQVIQFEGKLVNQVWFYSILKELIGVLSVLLIVLCTIRPLLKELARDK